MRPSQILDSHADLLERLEGMPKFRGATGALIEAEMFGRGMKPEEFKPLAQMMVDVMRSHVSAAHVYRVTEDMTDLVEFAAASLEEEDEFDASLAPTGCGIVRWDRPVLMAEAHDVKMHADWAVWGPGIGGRTMIWWFADPHRQGEAFTHMLEHQGYDRDVIRQILGRWAFVAWDQFRKGLSLGPPRLPLDEKTATKYMEGRVQSDVTSSLLADLSEAGSLVQSNDARLMQALWLMLGQTITTLVDEPLERASKRRAVKKKLPPRVTTIALRRTEHRPREGEEVHVEWQHRWIVRGHWRWQACGAGRQERKRIWVNPFVKGPEGMPLKQSEKVYDLRR